jgi:thiamine kinase-like enzyme
MIERREGKGHKVYLVDLFDKKVVVRVKKKRDLDIELKRIPETKALNYLSDASGFGVKVPKVHYSGTRFMVQSYIDHDDFENIEDRDVYIKEKASHLKNIHSVPTEEYHGHYEFSNTKEFYDYLVKSFLEFHDEHKEYLEAEGLFRQDIEKMLDKKELITERSLSICHGDAQERNFLYKDGKIGVIDWEHAILADPYYDIALTYCRSKYSEEHKNQFLEEYFSEEEIPHAELEVYKEMERIRSACVKIARKYVN